MAWHWPSWNNNVGILSIRPLGTNSGENLIEIHTFSFEKMHLKTSSGKLRSFCLGFNVLMKVMYRWALLHLKPAYFIHNCDVIMGTMASQITSLTIVYSTVYSDADQKKTSMIRVTGLCAGNSPGTGEFPAQKASNAEDVFIWWRHHFF